MNEAGDLGPRIDGYDWAGGREASLRFGPDGGPTALLALPLLEEGARVRSLGVALLRGLARRGIASALPELPGAGESLLPTDSMRLAGLRAAFAAAAASLPAPVVPLAIRSGALLPAGDLAPAWRLSPQTGAELAREWRRLRDAGDGTAVAGNPVAPELWAELTTAEPGPGRVVRLAGDPRPADRRIDAAPPWRRAEPAVDAALVAALVEDAAEWIAACAG